MRRLVNPVRRYAWGSVDAIPNLLGVDPDGEPQAELWLGAHPRDASRVLDGATPVSLLDLVREDPAHLLGPDWVGEARLPFLAKVIAVAAPLSLQVHPDAAHVARGYADEEARGVGTDADTRSFPDEVAKAEMIWALSEFRALCGVRPAEEAAEWLETLDVAALAPTAEALRGRGQAALRDEVARLLRLPAPEETTAALRERTDVLAGHLRWAESARVARELAARYPEDAAVAVALLLQPVVLAPGEATFIRPGQPHCYLSGTAFEVQANSDNVVRAGLTSKHVDVDLLIDTLDPDGDGVAAITGLDQGDEQVFAPGTARFALSVLRQTRGAVPLERVPGPQVFFCAKGRFVLQDGGDELALTTGQSAFQEAAGGCVRVCGAGMLLRVTTGRAGLGSHRPRRGAP